jgi:hypothetical protein
MPALRPVCTEHTDPADGTMPGRSRSGAIQKGRKSCGVTCFRVKCGVVGLIDLLKRHEGKTLEFKRDLSSPEGILKTLVAFANTAGGTVVIGVDDGSKNVRGLPDVLAAEEKLASLVSDWISPR